MQRCKSAINHLLLVPSITGLMSRRTQSSADMCHDLVNQHGTNMPSGEAQDNTFCNSLTNLRRGSHQETSSEQLIEFNRRRTEHHASLGSLHNEPKVSVALPPYRSDVEPAANVAKDKPARPFVPQVTLTGHDSPHRWPLPVILSEGDAACDIEDSTSHKSFDKGAEMGQTPVMFNLPSDGESD